MTDKIEYYSEIKKEITRKQRKNAIPLGNAKVNVRAHIPVGQVIMGAPVSGISTFYQTGVKLGNVGGDLYWQYVPVLDRVIYWIVVGNVIHYYYKMSEGGLVMFLSYDIYNQVLNLSPPMTVNFEENLVNIPATGFGRMISIILPDGTSLPFQWSHGYRPHMHYERAILSTPIQLKKINKLVMVTLISLANGIDVCTLKGRNYLADLLGCTAATIKASLRDLESQGYIIVTTSTTVEPSRVNVDERRVCIQISYETFPDEDRKKFGYFFK